MRSFLAIVAIGAISVLALDAAAAFASINFGVGYGWFSIGSLLIYGILGFFASRYVRFAVSPIAGALVALVESTVGWYISWIIGPGRVDDLGPVGMMTTIVFVIFLGAMFGCLGGLIGLIKRPS